MQDRTTDAIEMIRTILTTNLKSADVMVQAATRNRRDALNFLFKSGAYVNPDAIIGSSIEAGNIKEHTVLEVISANREIFASIITPEELTARAERYNKSQTPGPFAKVFHACREMAGRLSQVLSG